jgi:hypothetical protein
MIYDSFSFSLARNNTRMKGKTENHIHSGFLSEIHLSIYVFVLILTIFQELKSVLLSCLEGGGRGKRKKAREGQSFPFFLGVLTKTTQHISHKSSGLLFILTLKWREKLNGDEGGVSSCLTKLT